MDAVELLALYDQQLRLDAEVADADEVARVGPVLVATYRGRRRGFITYRQIPPATDLEGLVGSALGRCLTGGGVDGVDRVEWKTRGHDRLPGLVSVLVGHGFEFRDTETVMAGPVGAVIAADVPLAPGYTLHRAATATDIREAEFLAGAVFGDTPEVSGRAAAQLVARLHRDPCCCEMWLVRDTVGEVVCSGRVDFPDSTEFASVWGGSCHPDHRGLGLYRAITAARARSAVGRGRRFLHSDCTLYSRPILQRAGLIPITTTTPAMWTRPIDSLTE